MTPQLNDLLRRTSRSFYLTLRILPASVRPQIGLAYLLARATDTIADTETIAPAQRLDALRALRQRIQGGDETLDLSHFIQHHAATAESDLLRNIAPMLEALQQTRQADRPLIRSVLDTITSGQELDLQRFEWARTSGAVIALRSAEEINDYTYRVAGCVGEFWTKICRAHVFPTARLDDAVLLERGIRFGKGLQLVNILRDLPGDLRNGRCYLPADELEAAGLSPADLLDLANESKLRPVYDQWLDRAESHLAAGWEYTNSLPWTCARVRLACAWPILIGLKTIRLLRQSSILAPESPVKITRAEVKSIMFCTVLAYPLPCVWRRLATFPQSLPRALS